MNEEERNPNSMDKCIINGTNKKMSESNFMGIDHEDKKDVKLREHLIKLKFEI